MTHADKEMERELRYERRREKRNSRKKLDLGARLVCLLIALIIWIYMVNFHDADSMETLTLKIDVVGVDALSAHDDMMVYGMDKKTVNIVVKGTNRDLKEFSDSEYKASIDVSKIITTGEHKLEVVVKTPDNSTITLVSADPALVSLMADHRFGKAIPVETVIVGVHEQMSYKATASIDEIKVEGPRSILDRISIAVIEVGGNLADGQVREDVKIKFYDAMQQEISSMGALTYSSEGVFVKVSAVVDEAETE